MADDIKNYKEELADLEKKLDKMLESGKGDSTRYELLLNKRKRLLVEMELSDLDEKVNETLKMLDEL